MVDFCMSHKKRTVTLVLITLLVGGCGGGGGGGGGQAPVVNTPPAVNAGADQSIARNVEVTLSGSATDDGGTASLTYAWSQTSGTAVTLVGADTAIATFDSPDVAADETLQFALTVTDSAGAAGEDSVDINVIFDVAPTAAAGDDQNVEQNATVTLAGSGTDDNDPADLTYAWTQTAGTPVTINDPNAANATFAAPATTGSQTLEFRLTVTDLGGQQSTDLIVITVFEDLSAATISGKAEFEFVPFIGGGLNYASQEMRPIRGATIQLISAGTNDVIDSTTLDDNGDFVLVSPVSTSVFLRIRAELKRTGAPAWDVEVRDNTSQTSQPLDARPLYVLDGAAFDSGIGPQVVNIQAESGWTGTSYGATRAAAPFSVLDTIYNGIQLVISVDPDAVFAPLDAFWSVNNTPSAGPAGQNIENGEIGTSFYNGGIDSLFLLGDEGTDTEEYDTHVVAHEWGHYFEDNFSRSDSTGGSHSLSQRLDPRLAFGEGFGNAVSAMIMGSSVYFDTQGSQQSSGFSFSLETNGETSQTRGWYNERSVQAILYDIFDSDNDNGDAVSLGFGAIYDVLVGPQASGTPFTTIYPFIEALRANNPAQTSQIDDLLALQRIVGENDGYGVNETESAGRPDVILPIYAVVEPDSGTPVNVCSTNEFDPDEDGNKLGVRRFIRIPVTAAGNYTVDIVTTNPPAAGQSDPDAFVFRADFVGGGDSPDADRETFTLNNLTPGDYVMVLYEFSYIRGAPAALTQPNDRTCFDVTVTS